MFKRYKLRQLQKEKNTRESTLRRMKNTTNDKKDLKDRVILMLQNSSLLMNAYNKILGDKKLLNENIEQFTVYIFFNLMKCKKDKLISKNIDCVKEILNSTEFYKVENVSYEYFKSLFFLEKFPKRLVNHFHTKFKNKLMNESEFYELFKSKFLLNG